MLKSKKPLIEAVFISDIHLHPQEEEILLRFARFIDWALNNTRTVYILGDFFHVWAGDDAVEPWSLAIAEQLLKLSRHGIRVYFLAGNRDFLLGKQFAKCAQLTVLKEPAIIKLHNESILLVHGDRYCTKDKPHQWFRRLTRNAFFPAIFLMLPLFFRRRLAKRARQLSRGHHYNPQTMSIVTDVLIKHLNDHHLTTVIHGHIHKAALIKHAVKGKIFNQYVLSDWDDKPDLLCYDRSIGFYFDQM